MSNVTNHSMIKFILRNARLFLIIFLIITLIALLFIYEEQNRSNNKTSEELIFTQNEPVANAINTKLAFISGEINNPGVYEITDDTRVIDLVNFAGGFTVNANEAFISEQLNLSEKVKDEAKINIPSAAVAGAQTTVEVEKVNINNASQKELVDLPEIGDVSAQKIISARPINNIDELKTATGFSDAKIEKIKDLISF